MGERSGLTRKQTTPVAGEGGAKEVGGHLRRIEAERRTLKGGHHEEHTPQGVGRGSDVGNPEPGKGLRAGSETNPPPPRAVPPRKWLAGAETRDRARHHQ